jgi:uncharacterized protein YecE (DUF72 family)
MVRVRRERHPVLHHRLRRSGYADADLNAWADRIRSHPWTEAYAFLKHEEDSPAGPDAAVKLAALVGPG